MSDGRFEAFYTGFAQHPLLLWVAAAAGVALLLARRDLDPGLRRYGLALGGLSVLDAWLTTRPIPGIGAPPDALDSVIPLFFVLAGDFRVLLLVCTATAAGGLALTARPIAAALGWTLLVPIASQLAVSALAPDDPRVLYLVYETMFFALAGALARWHPGPRRAPWLRALLRFVMLYYGLWAGADAWILATGNDLGFALRVIPNALYYGGLIAAIAWLAPRASTDLKPEATAGV